MPLPETRCGRVQPWLRPACALEPRRL